MNYMSRKRQTCTFLNFREDVYKRQALKAAIEKQDFEQAAVLRDEIREMEKGEQSNG